MSDETTTMAVAVPIGQAILGLITALIPIALKAFQPGADAAAIAKDAQDAFTDFELAATGFEAVLARNDAAADAVAKP